MKPIFHPMVCECGRSRCDHENGTTSFPGGIGKCKGYKPVTPCLFEIIEARNARP